MYVTALNISKDEKKAIKLSNRIMCMNDVPFLKKNSQFELIKYNKKCTQFITCDSYGNLFSLFSDGSVEYVIKNIHNSRINDFEFSHDCSEIAICYEDFVLVRESWTGIFLWETNFQTTNQFSHPKCLRWAPNELVVIVCFSDRVIMISRNYIIVNVDFKISESIKEISYNEPRYLHDMKQYCYDNSETIEIMKYSENIIERFYYVDNAIYNKVKNCDYLIAILTTNEIKLIKNWTEIAKSKIIKLTQLKDIKFEWSNCGEFIAVTGIPKINTNRIILFYDRNGILIQKVQDPMNFILRIKTFFGNFFCKQKNINNNKIKWSNNDQTLNLISSSFAYEVLRVFKKLPRLSELCVVACKNLLKNHNELETINLPVSLKESIRYEFIR